MFTSMGRSRSDKIFSLKFCRGGGGSGGRYPLNLFSLVKGVGGVSKLR